MNKKVTKWIAMLMVATLGISMLASCKKGDSNDGKVAENSGVAKEVNIYTAMPDSEIPTYKEAFEKDTGIKLNYVRLSSGEMMARVEAEKGHPQAALMAGGPSDTYIEANARGLLEPYQSPELKHVESKYLDPTKTWNPYYVGAIGFCINKDWFKNNKVDIPKSWDDLLKPEFKGQIAMAHPATSGTAYTVLATILQLKKDAGWDYMKKLNNNIRQYTKSGSAPANMAGLGEVAIGIVFAHDGLKPKVEGYPVDVVFPQDGTGYEVGALALIKGADKAQQEAAKKFIDWSMSKKGQEAFIESKSNRLPLNTTANVTEGLIPLKNLPVIDYDAKWAGDHKKEFVDKFKELVANADNVKK